MAQPEIRNAKLELFSYGLYAFPVVGDAIYHIVRGVLKVSLCGFVFGLCLKYLIQLDDGRCDSDSLVETFRKSLVLFHIHQIRKPVIPYCPQ
jgi:hypothetical protein